MSDNALLKKALLALQENSAKIERYEREKTGPIAVVGMACRFPGGADSPGAFWQLLENGVDAIREVPDTRWNVADYPGVSRTDFVPYAGLLEAVDAFDAAFFRISSREARSMDPQQRLLLEVSWEALEEAGSVGGQKIEETGVFVGITQTEYGNLVLRSGNEQIDSFFSTGNSLNVAAGRISYLLGFQGPSMAVDTACSSSLVSIHLACQSLRNQECRQALAGGVNLLLTPFGSIATTRAQMLAKDGRCKAFDQSADGYVRSEGCGMVVLKRLSDALADGDVIKAVIRASGVSQDGASSGLTVPSGPAQQKLLRQVLERAKLKPADLDYIEAHGTGTSLGDPIEFGALGQVFGKDRPAQDPLLIGTVKSNIGHLESAAGIAGFIKAVLCLQHGKLAANLHFNEPSRHIDWARYPVRVVNQPMPWPQRGEKRRAGVSSFGFSGTNAHVILEEAVAAGAAHPAAGAIRPAQQVLFLAAKSEAALRQLAGQYQAYLARHPDCDWAAVCYTAAAARAHFEQRLAVRAGSAGEARQALERFLAGEPAAPGLHVTGAGGPAGKPALAFLFTGQGLHYARMGEELYRTQPVFRKCLDECNALLASRLPVSLLEALYPAGDDARWLDRAACVQPALFAVEYALARLWQSWGVQPAALLGHSIGEYVAACVAGVFSLEDALQLVAHRGRLMQALPEGGKMASVLAGEATVRTALAPYGEQAAIAAINGEAHVVIAGPGAVVDELAAGFKAQGVPVRELATSHAFHSPLMEPMLADFEAIAGGIAYSEPEIEIVSTLTGQAVGRQMSHPGYWVQQIRATVQLQAGVETLAGMGINTLLEIGPGPALIAMTKRMQAGKGALALPSLTPHTPDTKALLDSLSQLYVHGCELDWERVGGRPGGRKISLPTYPFQRKTYWVPAPAAVVIEPLSPSAPTTSNTPPVKNAASDQIRSTLIGIIAALLEEPPADVSTSLPFLEMGADSILLMEAGKKIENAFGLEIPLRMFFDELQNIEALTGYIAERRPALVPPAPAATPARLSPPVAAPVSTPDPAAPAGQAGSLNYLIEQQLALNAQLISLLREKSAYGADTKPARVEIRRADPAPEAAPAATGDRPEIIDPFASFRNKGDRPEKAASATIEDLRNKGLTEKQQRHLAGLVERINRKTAKSKAYADESRPFLADNRASAGFRYSTKEMLYPIVGHASKGARFRDIDGNEYLDISMGFGVNLFGHNADFIEEAIGQQLRLGMQLGPQSELAADVASRIAAMTGVARVAFCNSGTEAIMTALRLARTRTGRQKIALFAGAYHGHFDGVLGTARALNENPEGTAVAPGVPANTVKDVIVLDYDNPVSLELLRQYQGELAGVLVEPVQSRRPHLQPGGFLRQLRTFTTEAGIPLIFDEVITGFRIAPGGAQAHFGVQADLVAYGKIIGGGLPLGVVAGTAEYLDCIDGGNWTYGDASYPKTETTFFAGTFCKHPLTMAAARAVLQELARQGPALQDALTARTAGLARQLNAYFSRKELPIQLVHFGALFRFASKTNIDLLFYHLLEKGVYVWEGRNCFLSTAHTDEDVAQLIAKVKESVEELEEGGFLGGTKPGPATAREPIVLPATLAQEQLWLLAQVDRHGSIAYNLSSNLELTGPFDATRLDEALALLVERHEALRTVFSPDGRQMIVRPGVAVRCRVVDFSHLDAGAQAGRIWEWNQQESRTPFDLVQGPPFRCHLVKLAPQKHLIAFTVHHILLDGWSVVMLLKEVGLIYAALHEGKAPQLPPPMQFREYVALSAKAGLTNRERARDYWMTQFAGAVPALELPLDFPRPLMKTHFGDRLSETVSRPLMEELRKMGQKNGCTLFMTLLSAYALLLRKLSRQNDFIIGIPSARRFLPNSETVAGYCSHLLPLRQTFREEMPFSELLRNTRNRLLEGFEHEDFSFSELVEKLNERENMINNPFTRAVFNLEPTEKLPALHQLESRFVSTPRSFSPYDLMLNVIELEDRFEFEWDYNTGLFEQGTIQRLSRYFGQLLQQVVAAPHQPVSSFSLRGEAGPREADGAAARPETAIHQLFEAQAAQTPDATAIVQGAAGMTYREVEERANQWAHYLRDKGVQPGQLVGVLLEKSAEAVALTLGIWKIGAAPVSVDPAAPAARLDFIFAETAPALLITQQALRAGIAAAACEVLTTEQLGSILAGRPVERPAVPVPADALAYIVYTSGSTGVPKGIMTAHAGVVNYFHYLKNTFRLGPADVVLQLAPAGFDAAVRDTFGPLVAGARLVLGADSREVGALLQVIPAHRVTCLLSTVPFLLSELADQLLRQPADCTSVRLVMVSGEVLSATVARKVTQAFGGQASLVNQYGPTECTMTSTFYPVGEPDARRETMPIGRPVPNAVVYLRNGADPAPEGAVGEIVIGGPGVARGYFKRPELTAEKFVVLRDPDAAGQRVYRTGDLGRLLPDGNLEFLGRMDNQVKIRGFRVEPDEIEALVATHPGVKAGAVIVEKDAGGEDQLVACLVRRDDAGVTGRSIRQFLAEHLPQYAVPSEIRLVDALPLTPNGKVDRKALKGAGAPLASGAAPAAPGNAVEDALAAIWRELLGKDQISIHDEFFQIGGNSLKAIQLIGRIQRKFGKLLTVADIFAHPSIHRLGKLVGGAAPVAFQAITPLPAREQYPVSHAQRRLWIVDQFEKDQVAYNVSARIAYREEIDLDAFRRAFDTLVQRHESLRTVFVNEGGQPSQRVLPFEQTGFAVQYHNLSLLDPLEAAAAVEVEQAEAPFALDKGPLLRVKVLQTAPATYEIVCSTHHIVSDGWSMNVLLNEVLKLYQAFRNGRPNPLEPLKFHYKDFTAWQNQQFREPFLQEHRDFWKRYFADPLPQLELPYDQKRPDIPSFRGGLVPFGLDAGRANGLRELGRRQDATLFMTLIALVKVLLYRYSGQKDIIVGVPLAGRDQRELENQIGFYVNTLGLRSRLSGEESFGEVVARVKANMLETYPRATYPFDLIVEDLGLNTSPGRSPLFDVMVQLQDTHLAMVQEENAAFLREGAVSTNVRTSKFDLTFNFTLLESSNTIEAYIEYNTDLFFRSTIEKMKDDLQCLMDQTVASPTLSISDQALLPLDAHDAELEKFNKPLGEF